MPIEVEEKEPMLLLDTTGSMRWPVAAGSQVSRKDLVQEALRVVVTTLAREDTQGEHEEGGGGLRTITFADGTAHDLGDLNPGNFTRVWNSIRWGGGTRIAPGMRCVLAAYNNEFQTTPQPTLMLLVIIDGEAEDTGEFITMLNRIAGTVYAAIAVVGYGEEHDAALRSFQAVAQTNAHVRVFSLAEESDPNTVAQSLLRMIA